MRVMGLCLGAMKLGASDALGRTARPSAPRPAPTRSHTHREGPQAAAALAPALWLLHWYVFSFGGRLGGEGLKTGKQRTSSFAGGGQEGRQEACKWKRKDTERLLGRVYLCASVACRSLSHPPSIPPFLPSLPPSPPSLRR